jgi:dihydroorotase
MIGYEPDLLPPRQAPGRVVYVNARLINPASGLDACGGLLTDGEVIADLGPAITTDTAPADAAIIDCNGLCLAPGLVDIRVQLREPGEEYKETLLTAGRAAAAGGVTSMICLPNTQPVIDDMSVLEFVARRARKVGLAKVYGYAAITKQLEGKELAEIGLLSEAGAVAFTDGIKPLTNARVMSRALSYAATFGLMIVQHAQEPELLGGGVMNSGETAARLGLSGMSPVAEVIMVERDIRLAELTGGRLHFAHLSTSEALNAVRRAKARGLNITCDTAPPYFALNEAAVGEYRTFAKLDPPLRSEDDRQAVVAAISDGTVDAIASDHAPQDQDAKRLPFAQAAFGGCGLESLLPVTLELYQHGTLSLIDALRLLTSAPADLMGLKAGRLAKDRPADLILFDPERGWKFEADAMLSKSKNSPFDGRLVQGRVLRTVIDGRTVFQRSQKP